MKLTPIIAIVFLLGSCTSLKPFAGLNNRQATQTPASNTENKQQVKFLEDISVVNETPPVIKQEEKASPASKPVHTVKTEVVQPKTEEPVENLFASNNVEGEKTSAVQLKYAILMNTDAAYIQNLPLYNNIDEWYGTRYKLGGTSKKGIDCSAFVQTVFISAFGIALPRTARDQYRTVKRISRTELKEGDLLFFNTRGRGYASHVGIYLQNNKFVHASVSGGVIISDMFEPYYVRKFIGAGRIEGASGATSTLLP